MDPVILSSHSPMRLVGSNGREIKGKDTGIRKFKEKVKEENGNKLIIFDQDRYAIFDAYGIFILCGRNILKPTGTPEKITAHDILKKYGVQLD